MKKPFTKSILPFFEIIVKLWSVFLFLVILFNYFVGQSDTDKITISHTIFHLTGLISIISAIVLVVKKRQMPPLS